MLEREGSNSDCMRKPLPFREQFCPHCYSPKGQRKEESTCTAWQGQRITPRSVLAHKGLNLHMLESLRKSTHYLQMILQYPHTLHIVFT